MMITKVDNLDMEPIKPILTKKYGNLMKYDLIELTIGGALGGRRSALEEKPLANYLVVQLIL